ncbi:hypothetical protein AB1Y20_021285 [Prymnesium parvum]|uniref:Uncharacterized protein n=1 Tax=Prymnesium parvum TaxID=97485 RepID=A0AB34JL34_PRYPA
MVPAQACVLHAPVQPKSGGVAQDDWLMQKAIEVSMLCRSKIKNASDLEERRVVVERLALFMEEIKQACRSVSVTLGIERGGIFQCLIQMHSGGVSFDSQVEDDNDILMAENTVAELLEFYKRLYASAEKQGEAPYAIYKLVSVF